LAQATRPDKTANPPDSRKARRRRWIAVIALVVIAHVLVLLGLLRMPVPRLPDIAIAPSLEAVLLPPPAPPAPPAPPRQPRPRPAPPAQPAPAPQAQAPAPAVATSPGGESTAVTGTGGEGTAATGAASAPTPAPGPPAAPPAPPAPQYAPPPSATMHYSSFVNGVQNPDGLIRWEQDGSRYRLAVETRVLWFRFVFQSAGEVGPAGLTPLRYEEARRSKKEVARFDAAAGVIVFEARGNQVPMPPGIQDRFSVFLQLVGWVGADPRRYATPGVTDTFNVADTRDVEPMQVQYVGEESLEIGGHGVVITKHFVRLPRHPGDKRRVEIWLAPALKWLPARLRQTEPDGTQIDLVYRSSEGR